MKTFKFLLNYAFTYLILLSNVSLNSQELFSPQTTQIKSFLFLLSTKSTLKLTRFVFSFKLSVIFVFYFKYSALAVGILYLIMYPCPFDVSVFCLSGTIIHHKCRILIKEGNINNRNAYIHIGNVNLFMNYFHELFQADILWIM